ncbi:hypothetical protein A2Z23_01925 [Candidatus Curtissbacteria bacterium RBG_16_39_7]|uniref:Uncharacterized protein n=1 Tax=Candidatus Curtissbacteria bacterium RBG_16_39_7 TaxID=1797707 RepID=A0A1F5G497_9BACT|nr:MAG: hypothetical protein A2Z23_01925 [Candidatus Curtissbacteria bacterium RBG_16_39_7]
MFKEEKPLSYYVLSKSEYRFFQENLAGILAETKKRGEVWLYPLGLRPSRNLLLRIWIYGNHRASFFFDANAKEFRKILGSEGKKMTETKEDMLLSGRYAWLAYVRRKTPGFVNRHYPGIRDLPIRFFSDYSELREYEDNQKLKAGNPD